MPEGLSPQLSNGDSQASDMHAQDGVPSHESGIGEQWYCGPSCVEYSTHVSSAGQSSHDGTVSQISAGTHVPVQQAASTSTAG